MPRGPDTFGSLLRQFRLDAELSQDELAQRANVAQSTLSAYETGAVEPSLRVGAQIARALDVSLDELAAPFTPRPSGRRRPQPLAVAS